MQSKQDGAGRGSAGGAAGEQPGGEAEGPIETPADPANLAYAEKQTELALEHLRDQLAKEKHGLLDRLGWTKEDAKQFLDRWEGMRREAKQQGPKGEEARKRLNETLQSLGLRPRGTTIGRGAVPADQQQNLRDAGRFAAPPEWAEQYRDYTRGIADPKQSKGIRERP
jgi:hypothetical protein